MIMSKNDKKRLRRAMSMAMKANILVGHYFDIPLALSDAIRLANDSAVFFNKKDYAVEYSGLMNLIGLAYRRLSELDSPTKNLALSISYYRRALEIEEIGQYDAASTYINIAIAYRILALYENGESNVSKAKAAITQAINLRGIEKYPYECATAFFEMGLTLIREYDLTQDIEKLIAAISYLSEASEVFYSYLGKCDLEVIFSPVDDYTFTNFLIGKAYAMLSEVKDTEENLVHSKEAFLKVLEHLPRDKHPEGYGDVLFELGNALFDLYKANGETSNLLKAIGHYEESTSIYTVEKHPYRYASIIDEMGKAYLHLAKESHVEDHIRRSLSLFDQSYAILLNLDESVKEEVLKNYGEAMEYYNRNFYGGTMYA